MTSVIIYNSRWLRPVGTLACMMEGITSSVCTQTVQGMDYTCNMKGSLGEALRASLTLTIILHSDTVTLTVMLRDLNGPNEAYDTHLYLYIIRMSC